MLVAVITATPATHPAPGVQGYAGNDRASFTEPRPIIAPLSAAGAVFCRSRWLPVGGLALANYCDGWVTLTPTPNPGPLNPDPTALMLQQQHSLMSHAVDGHTAAGRHSLSHSPEHRKCEQTS